MMTARWPRLGGVVTAAATVLAPARTTATQELTRHEPIIGGPCEGCEAVFDGLPERLSSDARIAPDGEAGEPMLITGAVRRTDGSPAPGVIVYAYHTNARGVYPRDEDRRNRPGYRHGTLRGWAMTGPDGRYRFRTIRPASYPDRETPAHVHMHVIEPGCCTYYIASIHFADDPLLSSADLEALAEGRGGSGLVHPRKNASGEWVVRRDIVLGQDVPGYPGDKEEGRDGGERRDRPTE